MRNNQTVTEQLQRLLTNLLSLSRLLALLAAAALWLPGQVTVFVTRHADRHATEPDATLTDLGLRQAEALGQLLKSAGIKHIYCTQFIRTQQTAAPTARITNVTIEIVKQSDLVHLTAKIRTEFTPGEAILIVGHRASVPQIVKGLSGKDIKPLGSSEYGRLVMVTLFPGGRSSVVTLHYGPMDTKNESTTKEKQDDDVEPSHLENHPDELVGPTAVWPSH